VGKTALVLLHEIKLRGSVEMSLRVDGLDEVWLGREDSNLHNQIQSLESD